MGDVNVSGAMAAAHALRFAMIEFDHYDGYVLRAIKGSAAYMESTR